MIYTTYTYLRGIHAYYTMSASTYQIKTLLSWLTGFVIFLPLLNLF